jgi:hypothetical protein
VEEEEGAERSISPKVAAAEFTRDSRNRRGGGAAIRVLWEPELEREGREK